ncbi:MAG TPA: hypothetical protein VGG69_03005 [Rhizomicrobium sp.]
MKLISILVSGACVAALSCAAAQAAPGIAGTWLATYDGGVHIAYLQWQKGGTASEIVDFASKTGNVQLGDWSTDGRGTYTLLLTGWTYDTKGNARTGRFVKTEDEVLSDGTYSGTFEVTYYDLTGNITFQHDGTVTAVRIEKQ